MRNILFFIQIIILMNSMLVAETILVDMIVQDPKTRSQTVDVVVETKDHQNTVSSVEKRSYVGIGVSVQTVSLDLSNTDDQIMDITLLAGYHFNKYFAIEGRYVNSIAQEDIFESSSWGIYLKPIYPMSEQLKFYALLGYGNFDAKGINNTHVNVDYNGLQWGLGAQYKAINDISFFADYVSTVKDAETDLFDSSVSEVDSNTFTTGIIYEF